MPSSYDHRTHTYVSLQLWSSHLHTYLLHRLYRKKTYYNRYQCITLSSKRTAIFVPNSVCMQKIPLYHGLQSARRTDQHHRHSSPVNTSSRGRIGPRVWNAIYALPQQLRQDTSFEQFSRKLKSHLFVYRLLNHSAL